MPPLHFSQLLYLVVLNPKNLPLSTVLLLLRTDLANLFYKFSTDASPCLRSPLASRSSRPVTPAPFSPSSTALMMPLSTCFTSLEVICFLQIVFLLDTKVYVVSKFELDYSKLNKTNWQRLAYQSTFLLCIS